MPIFELNVEQATGEGVDNIEVSVTPDRPLAVGRHAFRLIVEDDSGNISDASDVVVIVRDAEKPTAVLDAPEAVNFGRPIPLSGRRSSDVGGGRIVRFRWTMLS